MENILGAEWKAAMCKLEEEGRQYLPSTCNQKKEQGQSRVETKLIEGGRERGREPKRTLANFSGTSKCIQLKAVCK